MRAILELFRPISNVFGYIMRVFYGGLANMIAEPAQVSYFAITILLMGVISKLFTIPLMAQTMKSSQKVNEIQPKLDELKRKFGYDERILNQKIQDLYKAEGASMMGCSSCLPMVIQMILIITLFEVLNQPAKYLFNSSEQFDQISKNFFWINDLTQADPLGYFGLPLLNMLIQLALQFLSPQRKMQQQQAGGMNTSLMFMPLIFYFISIRWASGLLLYWIFGNILEIVYRGVVSLINKNKNANNERK